MGIKFDVIDLGVNIIDRLRHEGVLLDSTHQHLKGAERAGGFIAGGFAAKVVSELIDDRTFSPVSCQGLKSSLTGHGYSENIPHDIRVSAKRYLTDIDVYFHDQNKMYDFVKSCNRFSNADICPSSAGFGYDVTTYSKSFSSFMSQYQMIQYVTAYNGSPTEVCDTFDIYNAACAIYGTKLYVPSGWKLLKDNRCIHVMRLNTEWTINRISKWMHKHGYVGGMTQDSVTLINDWAKQSLERLYEKGAVDTSFRKETLTKLANFTKSLSAETLMEIAPFYAADGSGYTFRNPAIEELKKRSSKAIFKTL